MLYQIISFLLEVVTGLFGGACLLRLYMQYQRIPFRNPVGSMVFSLSDWIVLPLRRVIPALGRWDLASLAAAFLLKLLQFALLWLVSGSFAGWAVLPLLALFGLVSLSISGLTGLLLVYTVMSWMQTRTSLSDVIERLCSPLLAPIRRVLPTMGGLDLSALALLVLLQVASIVVGYALPMVLAYF